MKPLPEWDKLPRFALADSDDNRVFVVHLHWPRFVAEIVERGFDRKSGQPRRDLKNADISVEPLWIDQPDDMSPSDIARLMREAGDFYAEEMGSGF